MSKKIGPIILTIAGIFFLTVSIVDYNRSLKIDTWKKITAVVITSRLDVTSHSRKARKNQPLVRYEYEVNGKRYESRRIRIANGGWSRESAKKFLKSYPKGSKTIAFYDPKDPSFSILKKDFKRGIFFVTMLIGSILALTGLFLLKKEILKTSIPSN